MAQQPWIRSGTVAANICFVNQVRPAALVITIGLTFVQNQIVELALPQRRPLMQGAEVDMEALVLDGRSELQKHTNRRRFDEVPP